MQKDLSDVKNNNLLFNEGLKKQWEILQQYRKEFIEFNDEYIKTLTEIEQHIKKNKEYIKNNDEYIKNNNDFRRDLLNDFWFTKYGYDNLISDLQMTCVENLVPGNREKLLRLKDMHKGESCFIIGNGPSLKTADLDILKEHHIFCFGSKRINLIFNKTEWRPDVWGASDLDYIRTNQKEIADLKGFIKLLCCQTIVKEGICIDDAIYYPFIQMERNPPEFNSDVRKGVHFWGTITCKLINFAVYMGFEKIFLLGVDNTYPIKEVEEGRYELNYEQNSHFTEGYLSNEEIENSRRSIIDIVHSMKYTEKSYESLKWHCDQMGIKVINATRGGTLEIFERMDFEHAINEIK